MCIVQGNIVIHEVYENGAAARDGRLCAGDQILEVGDEYLVFYLIMKTTNNK